MSIVLTGGQLVARLKVTRHQKDFTEISLQTGKSYVIGRKDDCDVVLQPDPGISRSHLTLQCQADGKWLVQVFSQHIPIVFNGKTYTSLVCESSPTLFYITPYVFELIDDTLNSVSQDEGVSDAVMAPLSQPDAQQPEGDLAFGDLNHAEHVDSENIGGDLNGGGNAIPGDIFNDESFIGSEEKTSELNLTGEPYLKFMFSTHSESIRLKGNKWIAGRDSIAQIHLDDKKASRQHFSIEKVGEMYFIKDLKSANGTLLNGQEIKAESREIKSGDIITVNQLTIIFELRDLSFSDKLKDLPLQAYSGPMILTSQEWDLQAPQAAPVKHLSVHQLAQLPGTVQKVVAAKNNSRPFLIGAASLVIVLAVVFSGGKEERSPSNVPDPQMKTFESLSVDDKRLVRDSYALAQNLYQEGKIQNALNEINRLHKVVPFYKDSKEIEVRLQEAQETLRQKEFIVQQQRDQEKTRMRVVGIVGDCREKFKDAVDSAAAKNCLSEALQLDPENSDAQSLLSEIEMRLTQANEAQKRLAEFNENVAKGRELYYKAKNLLQNKEYQEAISAFSIHMNSQLPDPDKLRDTSKRNIASIEKMISGQKYGLMQKARNHLAAGQARDAVLYAEKAKHIDPYDYKIANFIEQTRLDLENQMRNLYTDSVIEERFGNLELSKAKWKEIITRDVPNGSYYQKAKRKLQQYGL